MKREYGRNRYQNMSEENNQGIKMEQKAFIFDKQCINKNAFQKK